MGVHPPPKSLMHIAYSPISTKFINSLHLFRCPKLNLDTFWKSVKLLVWVP